MEVRYALSDVCFTFNVPTWLWVGGTPTRMRNVTMDSGQASQLLKQDKVIERGQAMLSPWARISSHVGCDKYGFMHELDNLHSCTWQLRGLVDRRRMGSSDALSQIEYRSSNIFGELCRLYNDDDCDTVIQTLSSSRRRRMHGWLINHCSRDVTFHAS